MIVKKISGASASKAGAEGDFVDRIFEMLLVEIPEVSHRVEAVKRQLRLEFGGDKHYVATQRDKAARSRDDALREAFKGRNAAELARMFGCSRATVYRVIKSRG